MHTHPLWHEVKRVDSTDPGEHHSWPAASSVIVIEHNLDVIRNADWIIDLGPEGGSRGGEIVLTGTPTDLLAAEQSLIGQYLRRAEPAAA